jgi:SAM-dependent methyltransferase
MISKKIYGKWMATVQHAKISEILRRIRFSSPVLDVGSGPGFLEEKVTTVAVDTNLSDLKRFSGKRILASGDRLPFADKKFNTIFCIDTAHLLKNPSELARVLTDNGQLIASLPCNKWNAEKKLKELTGKFHMLRTVQKFLVETEPEWDAIAVFSKAQSSRRSRTAR